MDFEQVKAQVVPLIRKHIIPLSLGLLGLIFFTYGLISLLGSQQAGSKDITFEAGSDTQDDTNKTALFVDVEGAVVKPGVYKLTGDARIQEALIAAGGLSSKADRNWVAKSLNLASRLTDGAKIYIPTIGENVTSSNGALGTQTAGNTSGLININSATQAELISLPGIGEARSRDIIDNRPYTSIEELRSKNVVGQKVFEDIKDKVTY